MTRYISSVLLIALFALLLVLSLEASFAVTKNNVENQIITTRLKSTEIVFKCSLKEEEEESETCSSVLVFHFLACSLCCNKRQNTTLSTCTCIAESCKLGTKCSTIEVNNQKTSSSLVYSLVSSDAARSSSFSVAFSSSLPISFLFNQGISNR